MNGDRLRGQIIDDREGLSGIVRLFVNTGQEWIRDALRRDFLSFPGIGRITAETRRMGRAARRRARGSQRRKQQQIRRTRWKTLGESDENNPIDKLERFTFKLSKLFDVLPPFNFISSLLA